MVHLISATFDSASEYGSGCPGSQVDAGRLFGDRAGHGRILGCSSARWPRVVTLGEHRSKRSAVFARGEGELLAAIGVDVRMAAELVAAAGAC